MLCPGSSCELGMSVDRWALLFEALFEGRRLRVLRAVDNQMWESLAIEAG